MDDPTPETTNGKTKSPRSDKGKKRGANGAAALAAIKAALEPSRIPPAMHAASPTDLALLESAGAELRNAAQNERARRIEELGGPPAGPLIR